MLLPQTAEYAMRAMACLAVQPRDEALRAQDIADETGISPHYLSKVLRRLVSHGLLNSKKGHGGGFTLSRAPNEITFREVLAAADFDPRHDRCSFGLGSCDVDNPCPLHPAWSLISNEFRSWADDTTLASIGHDPSWQSRRE